MPQTLDDTVVPTANVLKPQHLLFVDHFLVDLDAEAAARHVGYAASVAADLLRRADIKAALAVAMAARAARTGITVERVLAEYARIAFADARDFGAWNRSGVQIHDAAALTPEETGAIAELVADAASLAADGATPGSLQRIKLFDKAAALRSLLRIVAKDVLKRVVPSPMPVARAASANTSRRARRSPLHQRFVEEYLEDFNAVAAARRAGYSARTANSKASHIRRAPAVAAAIAAGVATRQVSLRVEADRVVEEYACIAFADIGRIAAWDAEGLRLAAPASLADEDAAAIEHLGPGHGAKFRLRLYDKVYALDALAKHLGLLDPASGMSSDTQEQRRTRAALRTRLARTG